MPDVALAPDRTADVQPPGNPPLTQLAILAFYAPLAISWLFMSTESPISIAIVSRLGNAEVNTAATLMLMAISLWIESPVIDLLATSTTLAKSRPNYLALRRFALWLIVWVTAAHAVISATPVYHVVTERILCLPPSVVQALHLPLIVMIPWSGCIGWRRYLQGIMIRNGRTKIIGLGTIIRVSTMAVVGFGLFLFAPMDGLLIVATALIASVAAESLFIHLVSKPILREHFDLPPAAAPAGNGTDDHLTMRRLAAFHLPLTASTMVTLTTMPLIGAALARTPDKVLAMASWQVAITLLGLFRTVTFALTEPTIALYKDEACLKALRRFAVTVGSVAAGAIVLCSLLGLDYAFFAKVLHAEDRLAAPARLGLLCACVLPILTATLMHYRGVLTAHHQTLARLVSILVGISVLGGVLTGGVAAQWPGVIVAASALVVSAFAELGTLMLAWAKLRPRLTLAFETG